MLFNIKEWHMSAGNASMDCIRFGNGPKTMIMIQGLNTRGIKGAGLGLALMYRQFAKEYTVYLFDRNEKISDGYTVREMAADTAAAMDALGLKKADVLGVSQGGMIAQYLAIDRPELVNRLVLALTLSRNNPTVENVISGWIEMTRKGDTKAFVEDMMYKMYSEAYIRRYKALIPLLVPLIRPKNSERFIALAKACLSCRSYDELEKIQCPVFVIGAERDMIVGSNSAQETAEKLSCPLYIYKGLGHAAHEEAKDFNKRVLSYFNM